MGIFDKFLDIMKLNDDEYEYDNEDYDMEEEEEPVKSSFRKDRKAKREEMYDDEPETTSTSKITPISKQPRRTTTSTNGPKVCVIKPISIEDEIEITDTLLSGKMVIINMEGVNLELAQRIIDFVSGSTYAIRGNLQKISNFMFIATPNGVEISGDISGLLEAVSNAGL